MYEEPWRRHLFSPGLSSLGAGEPWRPDHREGSRASIPSVVCTSSRCYRGRPVEFGAGEDDPSHRKTSASLVGYLKETCCGVAEGQNAEAGGALISDRGVVAVSQLSICGSSYNVNDLKRSVLSPESKRFFGFFIELALAAAYTYQKLAGGFAKCRLRGFRNKLSKEWEP